MAHFFSQDSIGLPQSVREMQSISLTGNIVPIQWFKTITFDNGKPDTNSILILADICYWHKPSEVRDERSGSVIGYKKKFAEDLLRKSYSDLQNQFGLSDRQLRECLGRLEKRGVIKRIFRTLDTSAGRQNNIMYLELFPQRLKELTHNSPSKRVKTIDSDPIPFKGDTYPIKTGQVVTSNGIGVTLEWDSYPVITGAHIKETKTTTETTLSPEGCRSETSEQASPKIERENFDVCEELISIWNSEIPSKAVLNPNQYLKNRLQAVFRNELQGDVSSWKEVCKNFKSSKFLMGEAEGVNIKPDLTWLLDPKEPRCEWVLTKSRWTFDDRDLGASSEIDESALESEIRSSSEEEVLKDLRLFFLKKDSGFFSSYIKGKTIKLDRDRLFLRAGTEFACDKIKEQFEGEVIEFVKNRYGKSLQITK